MDHDKAMDRKINALIADSMVLVATPDNDNDLIVGYVIFDKSILHFVYIKKDFRQMGFATELIKQSLVNETIVTHLSKFSHYLLKAEYSYNPFKIPNY